MNIDEIVKKRNKIIILSGEKIFEFAPEIINKYSVTEGPFDGKTFFEAKSESDKLLCKNNLYALIDRVEKSKKGYVDALTQKGYPYSVAVELTAEAEKKGLINDRRFAECYLHTHQKNKGWFRLSAELRSKGVSDEIIEEFREEYSDRGKDCKKLAQKYMRLAQNTYKDRQKIYAKLLRKGYGADEIEMSLGDFGKNSYDAE